MKKIVKYLSVLTLTVSTSLVSYGKQVDENTAKAIGSNFLVSANVPGVNGASDLTTAYIATGMANGVIVTDYYAFNVNGGLGFVIVSGDDNIIPILAYSSESSFDMPSMNPSAKSWVLGYQNQITAAIANNLPAKKGTSDKWAALATATPARHSAAKTTTVSFPLLGTLTWDQEPGYNSYCPNGTGGRAVTGCVATAMAQVMKYWNWPAVGSGSHTYLPASHATYGYSNLTADFGNTAYNWTHMPLASSSTAIDTLMYHCGVSTDMDYGPNGSGTYVISLETVTINCAEFALKTYFHYKRSTLRGIARSGEGYSGDPYTYDPYIAPVPEATWDAMIQTELNAGRPVLYSGAGSDGGHNWVCDGWNSTSGMMFHFNFGWSGESNGYYSVDDIAPAALGTGGGGAGNNFNADQCVIIGIEPDSFATLTGPIEMASRLDIPSTTTLSSSASPTNYAPSSFTCTAKILNSGSSGFTGDLCVQVYDSLFNLVDTVQVLTKQTIAAGATSALFTFTPSKAMYSMIPGPYNFRVMYRATGTAKWLPVANNGSFYNENLVQVENNRYYDMELAAPIAISTGGTNIMRKSTLSFTTKILNQGSTSNFSGGIQAVLTNVVTGTAYTVQTISTTIFPNATTSLLTFTSASPVTAPVGIYALSVEDKNTGATIYSTTGSDYHENPILVNVIAATGIVTPSAIADKISIYPNPANDIINIATGGVTIDQVLITDIQGREIQKLVPDNNQSIITLPVSGYANGMYFVSLYSGDEMVTKKIVVTK